ncbi:MAG: carbon-nitrogen hydrolase family protein [Clostridiaceae bacterium]|nr:carbon-nitrogen hydrolase family protein [Clostridiaceae bacterium]
MNLLPVGLLQIPVTPDRDQNLRTALDAVHTAASMGAALCVLPEMWRCPYDAALFREYAESEEGALCRALAAAAAREGVYLVAGSVPELCGGRVYNTAFVYAPDGTRVARHRKAHLFDVDVPGGIRFRESETLSAGDAVTVFDTPWGKIGLCICFDLRFPELVRTMALSGARAILVPAAFNMTTGPAHWELLFRARALDNQVYTFGVAPARDRNASYVSYAHSIAVDPWGTVLCDLGEREGIQVVTLDASRVDAVRKALPLLSARRPELYGIE